MTITALKFLKEAAKLGWSFKVGLCDDGEYDYVGSSPIAAWNAVKEITSDWVEVFDAAGTRLGAAHLMAPGWMTCAPDESLVDYTTGGAMGALADKLIEEVIS